MLEATDAENQPPYKAINLHIACNGVNSGGEWRQLVGHSVGCIGGHNVHISVNRNIGKLVASALAAVPPNIYSSINQPLVPRNWTDPTLKVARPCLYVFPEGSGQAAIFAIPGYNMLINAGCAQHPGFWPVANHLDRLDAVLLTHWGVDNLLGLSSVLPVAFARPPDAVPDSILCLLTPPPNISGSYKLPDPNPAQSPLALSIPREMSKVMSGLKQQGTNVFAQTLTRGAKMVNPSQPVQLYQKVGQGSLELFPLTPTDEDSAELRKVTDDWAKASPSLIGATVPLGRSPPANKFTVPLLSHTSVSVLVVWKPSKDTDAILRILFVAPNAHQARVLVSLEAVVASNIYLRHSRAVPGDAERKRSTTTVPGSARRSVMPGTVGAPAKQSSVSSAGGAPAKSAPGRPSSLADKKPMSTRPVATQPRPTSKPTPANAKKESNASKPSAIPGAATKKAQSKPPATTQPVPAALSLAAETAAAIAAENDHDHTSNLLGDAPEPNPSLPTSPNNELVNNNVNGYHSEQNGAGALPGEYDADDGHGGLLISPNHPVAKTPLSATSPLSEDMMQLNMNAEPLSPARNPFEMTHSPSEPVATADLIDPMAAWGEPQGLPAPPPPGKCLTLVQLQSTF
ncbi:unnamed protein product [Echinostoma caproni]|uniref:Microtubule-associated protein futsch n=1 Tax=Echinostoma caproni TaxID=27848 RepID=A0A183AV47_9TREM|nr:unnamed protein product [Echinostoma caproni]